MADRQLKYSVEVDLETKEFMNLVKSAIEALNKIGTGALSTLPNEMKEASLAALELGTNLLKSINQETGKFDLLTFRKNLLLSGTDLESYAKKLDSMGVVGQEAFTQVARVITSAELPLRRANGLLDSLWVTMKNTMKWLLTTSALHTFIGSILTAYGYAQDLNESLTSILIVTNKSSSEMADFAKLANEAAKALSTTTTNYADASLIYFLLGLDDSDVEARTEATIKYANAAGISAETASELLTAIWNNFDDGTQSLEYYIDVMTKLGATTASSSSEISEGLQKFAAVADSVGLSYEYAAAALATVTATTRESADIVGNAYKTLFSRIQGLKLGETLDDGTTLNKYSLALKTVGIDIKDTTGEIKDMDTILDEMGSKWKTLTKDTLLALAQTVAGKLNLMLALNLSNCGELLRALITKLARKKITLSMANSNVFGMVKRLKIGQSAAKILN